MTNVLITAGPTREPIDAVRFISNRSSGKMGYAMAQAAAEQGWQVTLISGPTSLEAPGGVKKINVESAAAMAREVYHYAPGADLIVMAAAVADYRPSRIHPEKMKKSACSLVLELEPTEDILLNLGKNKRPGQILLGFAAETSRLLEHATAKLNRKNLDWIAANDVSRHDRGFDVDTNEITLIPRCGSPVHIPNGNKLAVARRIIATIATVSRLENNPPT